MSNTMYGFIKDRRQFPLDLYIVNTLDYIVHTLEYIVHTLDYIVHTSDYNPLFKIPSTEKRSCQRFVYAPTHIQTHCTQAGYRGPYSVLQSIMPANTYIAIFV